MIDYASTGSTCLVGVGGGVGAMKEHYRKSFSVTTQPCDWQTCDVSKAQALLVYLYFLQLSSICMLVLFMRPNEYLYDGPGGDYFVNRFLPLLNKAYTYIFNRKWMKRQKGYICDPGFNCYLNENCE